jgi:hypothetical protein
LYYILDTSITDGTTYHYLHSRIMKMGRKTKILLFRQGPDNSIQNILVISAYWLFAQDAN